MVVMVGLSHLPYYDKHYETNKKQGWFGSTEVLAAGLKGQNYLQLMPYSAINLVGSN
jgi:hypothetical protein